MDGVVLGIINPMQPGADELLAVQSVKGAEVTEWCGRGYQHDELLREARRKGMAVGKTQAKGGPALPASRNAAVFMQNAINSHTRSWYLAISRKAKPFTDEELTQGELALSLVRSQFDHTGEPDLCRLLLGEDNRLIHADPRCEANCLKSPQVLAELASQLQPVAAQRWEELVDQQMHQATLNLNGSAKWVRFYRGRAGRGIERRHLYVELRPSTKDDLPPAIAFWSATLYDSKEGFFIPNKENKYSVGQNSGMKLNAKGGIEIYVAAEQPKGVPAENWLPITRKDLGIDVIMRIYQPDLAKYKTWKAPQAEMIKQ